MAEVKLRVGCDFDKASFDVVLRSIAEVSAGAQRMVAAEMVRAKRIEQEAAKASMTAAQQVADAAKRAAKEALVARIAAAKEAAKVAKESENLISRATVQAAEARVQAEENALKRIVDAERAAERKRAGVREDGRRSQFADIREMERQQRRAESASDRRRGEAYYLGKKAYRASAGAPESGQPPTGSGDRRRFFDDEVVQGSIGNMRQAAALGRRIASDMARGIGVDTDLASHVRANTELAASATTLSNQGFMPGQPGPAGIRQDPATLIKQARDVGSEAAFDPREVLSALSAFTAKTGDLQTGRDALAQLAQLARATGSSLHDMVDAAGDVSSNLGDVEDKGAKVVDVMRAIAGQGKVGAVEIKDLSVQMAKLAANVPAYAGNRTRTFAVLGAFAQEARAHGGAASASQAANAIASYTNQFSKAARIEGFKGMHINPFAAPGIIKPPDEVMLEHLQATKGDPLKMAKGIGDAKAQQVTKGFASIYREAYNAAPGNEAEKMAAGTKAYRARIEELTANAMKEDEILESFGRSMKGADAQAQLFNNRIGESVDLAGQTLIPKLIELGQGVASASGGLARFAAWMAEHPGQAITGAVLASIAKAGLEAGIKSAAGELVAFSTAAGPATMAIGGVAAAALAVAATYKAISDHFEEREKAQRDQIHADLDAAAALAAYKRGDISASALEEKKAGLEGRIRKGRDTLGEAEGGWQMAVGAAASVFAPDAARRSEQERYEQGSGRDSQQVALLREINESLRTLKKTPELLQDMHQSLKKPPATHAPATIRRDAATGPDGRRPQQQ